MGEWVVKCQYVLCQAVPTVVGNAQCPLHMQAAESAAGTGLEYLLIRENRKSAPCISAHVRCARNCWDSLALMKNAHFTNCCPPLVVCRHVASLTLTGTRNDG